MGTGDNATFVGGDGGDEKGRAEEYERDEEDRSEGLHRDLLDSLVCWLGCGDWLRSESLERGGK